MLLICYAPICSSLFRRKKEKMRMKKEDHILHYFKKIHDNVEKSGNANLKECGLTLAQGHILVELRHSKDGRAPLKEIERCMKVAQSTTAGMVARLESHGFVETLSDPEDKRIKIVAITELGMESTRHVRASMERVEDKLFQNLSPEERKTLIQLLQKVRENCD